MSILLLSTRGYFPPSCFTIRSFLIRVPVHPSILPSLSRPDEIFGSRERQQKPPYARAYEKWDSRVVRRYLQFGIRPVPMRIYNKQTDPNLPDSAMTLTTTVYQESRSYSLPNLEPDSAGLDRLLLTDWDPKTERPLACRFSSWRNRFTSHGSLSLSLGINDSVKRLKVKRDPPPKLYPSFRPSTFKPPPPCRD